MSTSERVSATAQRLCLSWDPGPTRSAFAIVSEGARGMSVFVNAGLLKSDDHYAIQAKLAEAAHAGAIVAVEIPTALHPRAGASVANLLARSKQLLATSRVAATIAADARGMGLKVIELPASKWRHAITRKSNASDAVIKRAVTMYCAGLPARSNAHVRDAIGLGLVTLWGAGGMR
jgi:Holliday junction resolvasome RuvABC endonuclease subunit